MIPPLLVITPPRGPVPATCIEVARAEGIELALLLRRPGEDPRSLLGADSVVATARAAALRAGVPVLLSCPAQDAAALAPAARERGLSGLQLKGDPSPEALLRARAAWPQMHLGASVHGAPRSVEADYLVFGPVFSVGTPAPFPKPAAGVRALAGWTQMHPRVFALGGVGPDTAAACVEAGAHGLAGISTFLGSRDALAETLRALVRVLTPRPDVPPSPRG